MEVDIKVVAFNVFVGLTIMTMRHDVIYVSDLSWIFMTACEFSDKENIDVCILLSGDNIL